FQHLDRSRVTGIDFHGPRHAVAQHTIDTEDATQSAAGRQDISQAFEGLLKRRSQSQGADTPAIVKCRGVQPAFGDELPADTQQARGVATTQVDGGTAVTLDVLLEIDLLLAALRDRFALPKANPLPPGS